MTDPHRDQPVRTAGAPLAQAAGCRRSAAWTRRVGRGHTRPGRGDVRRAHCLSRPAGGGSSLVPLFVHGADRGKRALAIVRPGKGGCGGTARSGWRRIAGAHLSLWLLPGRLPVYGIYRPASCALWRPGGFHRRPHRARRTRTCTMQAISRECLRSLVPETLTRMCPGVAFSPRRSNSPRWARK